MKKALLLFACLYWQFSVIAQTPTWSQDIAPIFYAHCTSCHHTGSIAPFPLLTYSDAYSHAVLINNDVSSGIMPPWPPDANYKHFVNERELSSTEISKIQQWATGGKPQGDITLAPAQPIYTTGSALGTVDLSVIIPTYTVSGSGDVYRNFPIPSGLLQGKYVTAIEVIPGNAQIVHHVLVYQDSTSTPATLDANDPGPGYTDAGGTGSNASVLLEGWAPGASPYYTPVGTGFRLPSGTNIVVQVHYPNGSQGQTDSTRINFKLSSTPVREITMSPILNFITTMTNGPINIPANQTKTYYEKYTTNRDYTFLSAFPHMHLIGQSIKSWANKPTTNDTIPFVNIPSWNFHWQGMYSFPNAVKVPSGSKLQAQAFYDNTSNNPNNPNIPPATVTAGEATTDEMMVVFFALLPYQNGDTDIIIDRRIFPQGATTFCNGQSVQLKTIEGQRYTYQWYKDGSSISNATSSSYTATQTGQYSVHITLGANNIYSDTVSVTTTSSPTANVSTTGSTSVCPGASVTLNASTGTGYTYQWYNDTIPISNATASSYSASTPGNYSVLVYNGCYAKSPQVAITNLTPPSSTITPSGSTTFCQGGSVTLSAPAGLNYVWTGGSSNQSILVSTAGQYKVTVTDGNNCTAVSSNVTVVVNSLPNATISANGNTTFCQGNSVQLTAPAGNNYLWNNSAISQSITVSQAGTYTVTVTDGNSCSAVSNSITTVVNALPTATISAGSVTTFCDGGSVQIAAPSNLSYHWNNNSNQQTITVSQTGNYVVTVTDGNACSASSNSISVTVNQLPTVSYNAVDTFACLGTSPFALAGGTPAGGIYTGNGVSNGNFDATSAGTGIQLISYVYTDNNGCTNSATASITVSICTGIDQVLENSIVVSPNPSNGNFEIDFGSASNAYAMEVYNVAGQLVYSSAINEVKQHISLINVPSAYYLLAIKTAAGPVYKKLLVEH